MNKFIDKLSALTPQPNFKNQYNMGGMGYDNHSYANATGLGFDIGSSNDFMAGAGAT